MYNYTPNGFVVCATSGTDYAPDNGFFKDKDITLYRGVHRYKDCPLSLESKDKHICALAQEQFYQVEGDIWTSFISDADLLKRYVEACFAEGYTLRLLYVESGYALEKYSGAIPKGAFLGYEVCEIPLDACTVYDLYICDFYENFRQRLNENGLFENEKDAVEFMEQYNKDLEAGKVGDGDVELYVCKVFEINADDVLSRT